MAATYNRRCALCGQLQVTEDREALLEQERFEWDESLVDDFIAGNRHQCFDTDPFGARESERLIEAGLMVPELGWLIEVALERKQAAGRPAWVVFTAPVASSGMACRRPTSGSLRPVVGQVCDHIPADWMSRSPPWCGRIVPSRHRHAGGRVLDRPLTTRGRAYPKEPTMLKTAARPSTIPASPEVTLASVRGLDTTLVAEITDCRRRLDAISPEVIALLHEARQLEARAFRAADAIDAYSSEVESRVIEATGAHELMAAAAKVVGAYPVE